jgi:hypothetical protein
VKRPAPPTEPLEPTPLPARPGWRLAAAGVALFAAALAAFLSQLVFDGIPHVSDAVSYAFEGKILASGRLYVPPPPVPDAFAAQNVIVKDGRWCSKYPPGFPLLLAPGWLLGAPWLVNPLLLGLAVSGVYRLGRALYDEPTGLAGAALLAISPFALLMGAGFMSHVPALAVCTWCLVALVEGAASGRTPLLALAGALGGFAVMIRPLTAILFLAPAAAWCLWRSHRAGRAPRAFASLAAGVLPPLVAFLAYNLTLFGDPFQLGYQVYSSGEGFRDEAAQPLSPLALLPKRLSWYFYDLNVATWGWPFGDLLPLAALLLPRARRRGDGLLAACAALLVAGHSAYAYYDVNHSGPRYAFEALGALALLAARGLLHLAGIARRWLSRRNAERLAPAAAAAAAVLLAIPPLGSRLPLFARRLSRAYHGQTLEPLRRGADAGIGPDALVLVSGSIPASGSDTALFNYGSFFLRNGLDPTTSRRVYAHDIPPLREAILEAYPRAETWTVHVEFEPIPAEDAYTDNCWTLTRIDWRRLR